MKAITKFSTLFLLLLLVALPLRAKEAPPTPLDLARQLNEAFIGVAEKVSPAVVVINVVQKRSAAAEENDADDGSFWELLPPELRRRFEGAPQGPRGTPRRNQRPVEGRGSGFVITEDGYILTNNHVVENAEKIKVRFNNSREYDAEVKGTDPQSDLAVIKINAKNLTIAKMGDSAATRVGEFVIAIGAPFDLDYSVTFGHISAKGRSFEGGFGGYVDQDFIQTDASINPGNSGGPLVNLYGEVVGINSMIRGLNTGIGFAIPSNLAKTVADHLIREGKFTRSWLGVEIRGLREDQDFKSLVPNLEDGVVIRSVVPDSPAAESDLKASDVVTAIDGKPVKTSRQMKEEIAGKKPGQAVTLDVFRDNKNIKVKVKTAALPDGDNRRAGSTKPGGKVESDYGLTVKEFTRELAQQTGVEFTSGVIVTAVEQESAAESARIRPGDVITGVNRKPVGNPKQFLDAVKAGDAKKGIIINLISNGAHRFVVLKEAAAK